MEHSDWSGLCSERMGSRPQEREVKGEVSSWKSRARDLKKQNKKGGGGGCTCVCRMRSRVLGNVCDGGFL